MKSLQFPLILLCEDSPIIPLIFARVAKNKNSVQKFRSIIDYVALHCVCLQVQSLCFFDNISAKIS